MDDGLGKSLCDAYRVMGDEITRLRAEVEALNAENHNLNWTLGTPGYNAMATPEEQAEHEAAVARADKFIEQIAKRKAEQEAAEADAARFRWMRDNATNESLPFATEDGRWVVQFLPSAGSIHERSYKTLDIAIDAARAAQGEQG